LIAGIPVDEYLIAQVRRTRRTDVGHSLSRSSLPIPGAQPISSYCATPD
jgi:hypothetical protein